MASHDGKRRSHQRFLRKSKKLGEYLKAILSSVTDPDLELGKGRGRGEVFCRLPCRLFFPL